MARIGVLYDKDIKERVFGVFATNDSTGGYVLTLTASPTTITQGQSSIITATLTYNGNVVQGENVTFKIGSTTVSTGTTDANGKATYTYQSTVVGTIYITASSNNVRGVVDIAIKNYQLTLTTNKSIIGKTDTATITALLTDNGSSVSNETLSYVIKHGSTTISSGSKNTDSNGKATISYTGTGIGDVQVIVSYGSLLQETYEVYDCLKYDIATIDNHNDIWTLGNTGSAKLERKTSHSTLSELIAGTDSLLITQIPHSCILEFDLQVVSTNYSIQFCQFGQSPNATTRRQIPLLIQDAGWHHYKLELNNGIVVVSSEGTSGTYTLQNYDATMDMYFRFRTLNEITEINFKNFVSYPI